MIKSVPAKMPGCAKKLAVRLSLLSMISTSLPVGLLLFDDGLPVAEPPLVWFGSKSISLSSLIVSESIPILGFSTKIHRIEIKRERKKREKNTVS